MTEATLAPGEVEQCGGGTIVFDPVLRKHAVLDGDGHLHGYRGSLQKARALAQNIPAVNWVPPPPPEPSRSPDAMPLPHGPGVPSSVPKDQRGNFFAPPMSQWRRRQGLPAGRPTGRAILRKPKR